jgi:nitrate/nitrite transporter NarK
VNTRTALCLATLSLSAYLLAGCWGTREAKDQHSAQAGSVHLTGQLATWPLDIVADYSGTAEGSSRLQRMSSFQPSAGEAGFAGQIVGLVGALGGLGGIGLLIRNLLGQVATHKADSDEAWEMLVKKDDAAK